MKSAFEKNKYRKMKEKYKNNDSMKLPVVETYSSTEPW